MKKVIILYLFLTLSFSLSYVEAAPSVTISASAEVHAATGQVVIEGVVSSGQGQQVTLVVTRSDGVLEHVNQTTSEEGGKFAFRFKVNTEVNASYSAQLNGIGTRDKKELQFSYSKGSPDQPIVTPPANGNPRQDAAVVTEDDLKKAVNGKVSLVMEDGKKEVILPAKAGELLGKNELRIQMNGAVLAIAPEVLKQLQAFSDQPNEKDAVVLRVARMTDKETAEIVHSDPSNGLRLKAANQAVNFEMVWRSGEEERALKEFHKPILVELPYKKDGIDENLLGIYYYNPLKSEWEYVGGKVNSAEHTISASFTHFSAYAVLFYEKTYADVPASHWAYEPIKRLSAKHIVKGTSETAFSPGKDITRAEFTALLVRALVLKSGGHTAGFEDVPADKWYAGDIQAAYEAGIVQGSYTKRFNPDQPISREEMAVILSRAYAKTTGSRLVKTELSFADQAAISDWARAAVEDMASKKILQGGAENRFQPKHATTRAQAAQAIYNFTVQTNL